MKTEEDISPNHHRTGNVNARIDIRYNHSTDSVNISLDAPSDKRTESASGIRPVQCANRNCRKELTPTSLTPTVSKSVFIVVCPFCHNSQAESRWIKVFTKCQKCGQNCDYEYDNRILDHSFVSTCPHCQAKNEVDQRPKCRDEHDGTNVFHTSFSCYKMAGNAWKEVDTQCYKCAEEYQFRYSLWHSPSTKSRCPNCQQDNVICGYCQEDFEARFVDYHIIERCPKHSNKFGYLSLAFAVFGLGVYLFDVGSDINLIQDYFQSGNVVWGTLTVLVVSISAIFAMVFGFLHRKPFKLWKAVEWLLLLPTLTTAILLFRQAHDLVRILRHKKVDKHNLTENRQREMNWTKPFDCYGEK